jgi:hypothetical protein
MIARRLLIKKLTSCGEAASAQSATDIDHKRDQNPPNSHSGITDQRTANSKRHINGRRCCCFHSILRKERWQVKFISEACDQLATSCCLVFLAHTQCDRAIQSGTYLLVRRGRVAERIMQTGRWNSTPLLSSAAANESHGVLNEPSLLPQGDTTACIVTSRTNGWHALNNTLKGGLNADWHVIHQTM